MKYALAAVVVVAALGAGIFFAAGGLLLESAEPPSVDEAVEALDADRLAPRFDGEIAGLTIVPRQGEEYAYDTHCSTPQWDEYGGVEAGFATGTAIDIPNISGFEIVDHQVAWCDGRVAFNSVRLTSPGNDASVTIVRVLADPVLHKNVPADRVTAVTVDGQQAAHIEPVRFDDGLFSLSREELYIVEDFGITLVVTEGRVDLFDVAAQVLGGSR